MRRTIPLAAVLALVAFPLAAIAAVTGSESSPPTGVYSQTDPDECLPNVGRGGGVAMSQDFSTAVESNVLVYFTTRWGRLNVGEEGLVYLGMGGQPDSNEWSWGGTPSSRISGTVMWTFDHVPAGDHNAFAYARVDPVPGGPSGSIRPVADVTNCALTVVVMPVQPFVNPIGTGYVDVTQDQVAAGGYEVKAFVPTGSLSDGCLVTLAESDFAVWGTTVYCGVRQFDGQDGLLIHIFLGQQAPATFVFGLTVYQPFAQGYGEPVLYTD